MAHNQREGLNGGGGGEDKTNRTVSRFSLDPLNFKFSLPPKYSPPPFCWLFCFKYFLHTSVLYQGIKIDKPTGMRNIKIKYLENSFLCTFFDFSIRNSSSRVHATLICKPNWTVYSIVMFKLLKYKIILRSFSTSVVLSKEQGLE